jgi:hypothetical protein
MQGSWCTGAAEVLILKELEIGLLANEILAFQSDVRILPLPL